MAETDTPDGATADGVAAGTQPQPRLSIVAQYVKDLSFENPRGPGGLTPGEAPEIKINVDTRGRQVEGERYEVELVISVNATAGGNPMFVCELTYAGLFGIANMPEEAIQPMLLIECPRLLFPFARRVVADATRDGGFPPLMIDPIDFMTLYRRRAQQQAQAAGEASPAAEPS